MVLFGWLLERFSISEYQEMRRIKQDKNLIYDVGMNLGQDTDFYLKCGFRVVAFEADPNNAASCRKRFAKEIEDGRLTIVEGAITGHRGTGHRPAKVKFFQNEDHAFWGTTSEDFAQRSGVLGTSHQVIEVDAVDFGSCVEQHGMPYYLKADIVGDEVVCLRSLRNFDVKPDYLSIRSEKVIFDKLEKEFDLLTELGYDRFKAIQQEVTDWKTSLPGVDSGSRVYTFDEGASGPFGEMTDGLWKSREAVTRDYRRIFTSYWLFGDYSFLAQTDKGKRFISALERVARRPLPGWYDTHAKHSSVE